MNPVPYRKNVLVLAFLMVVLAGSALVTAAMTTVDDATIIAVAGLGLTPLGMIAKELLTDPPPPVVPAPIVSEIINARSR